MVHSAIFSWVTFIYFGSFVFYLIRAIRGNEVWGKLASLTAFVGFAMHSVAFALRWQASYGLGIGRIPLTNLYESLIFFAWAIVLLHLVIEWRIKNKSHGAFVLPFAFLCMAFASLSPTVDTRILPLLPALQSNWLASHVITCFMGYASFAIACGFGIMCLVRGKDFKAADRSGSFRRILLPEGVVDDLIYQIAAMGFIFLTLGIITGSVWAHYAWGSYWSWDPKETWSLITWIVYAIMLHARFVAGWRGTRIAIMSIVGFAVVLCTYLGVNYLPGLHSYLKS
jgi:cytochrome c-type biogenesis protein CcsB